MKALGMFAIFTLTAGVACGGATIGDDVVLQEPQAARSSSASNPSCTLSPETACGLTGDLEGANVLRAFVENESRAREVGKAIQSACVEIAALLGAPVPEVAAAAADALPACDLAAAALAGQTPRLRGASLPTTDCSPLTRAGCSATTTIAVGDSCRASGRTAAGTAPSPETSEPLGTALAKLVVEEAHLRSLMRASPQSDVATAATKVAEPCAIRAVTDAAASMASRMQDAANALGRVYEALE